MSQIPELNAYLKPRNVRNAAHHNAPIARYDITGDDVDIMSIAEEPIAKISTIPKPSSTVISTATQLMPKQKVDYDLRDFINKTRRRPETVVLPSTSSSNLLSRNIVNDKFTICDKNGNRRG